MAEAARHNGKEGLKTRGMPKDFQTSFSFNNLVIHFHAGKKGQSIALGKAEYVSKLFLKPTVRIDQIFFDIQQNVICFLSCGAGQRNRDV